MMNEEMMEETQSKDKLSLVSVKCPTCGEKIKYKKGDTDAVCMMCGSTYEIGGEAVSQSVNAENTLLRVEGIKTSSSALAFAEQLLSTYDWKSFVLKTDTGIKELDELCANLKSTSADDYKTWVVCFISLVTPFYKKLEYREKVFEDIVEEFKKGNLDAYGMYEDYKSLTTSLLVTNASVLKTARTYLDYAVKYGMSEDEKAKLEETLNTASAYKLSDTLYPSVESVPKVKEFLLEEERKEEEEFKLRGIDAPATYEKANGLLTEKKYDEALDLYLSLGSYKDSDEKAENINRVFWTCKEAFIHNDIIYYLQARSENGPYDLYSTKNPTKKPIATIDQIITGYAGKIYYFEGGAMKAIVLETGKVQAYKNPYTSYYLRKSAEKLYLTYDKAYVHELDLKSGKMTKFAENIEVVEFKKNYLHAIASEAVSGQTKNKNVIFNLDTKEKYDIGYAKIEVVDYFDGKMVYTANYPNKYNKRLYSYSFEAKNSTLLENNINGTCKVIDDRIYYFTLDNLNRQYLITIDADGTNRKELTCYAKELLFAKGEWLYFIKSYKWNTALCKMRLDGTCVKTIASQIDEFVKLDKGDLYYIDDERDLRKVRMDGKNNRVLAYDVTKVLKVDEKQIVYAAIDQKDNFSVYVIDANGGRRKGAYRVTDAVLYDDNTVYYVKVKVSKNADGGTVRKRFLCMLNLLTYEEQEIIELTIPQKQGCYLATCVYNSYDCPQVWMLRRYRDNYLDNRALGRLFIKVYYAISPTLVKIFGQQKWFRGIVKFFLDKKLKTLKNKGYQDTPYNDKY